MPLTSWEPSIVRRQAFEAGLRHLAQLKRISRELPVYPQVEPIHVFGVRDVLEKQLIQQAGKLVSWRYFAGTTSTETALGDVDASSPPKLSTLRYGPKVKEMLVATEALEQLPEVRKKKFQLRLLRIPGLLLEAFWLTPSAGEGESLVVPARYYKTLIKELDRQRLWTMSSFLETIRPYAEKVLALEDSPARKPNGRRQDPGDKRTSE